MVTKVIFKTLDDFNLEKKDNPKPKTAEEIRKNINNDYSFTRFLSTILEHNIKTLDTSIEYLTLISKKNKILKKLIKGTEEGVSIPLKFKNMNFHLTIHNHSEGAIIPSYQDMEKNFNHHVRYGVITGGWRIGVVKYNMDLTPKDIKSIMATFSTFHLKLSYDFEVKEAKKIKKCKSDKEYDKLFYKFISENNDKYVNEFNDLLKDYNIEITYYNIKKLR